FFEPDRGLWFFTLSPKKRRQDEARKKERALLICCQLADLLTRYSLSVTVILRLSPPSDAMTISPVARLRMLLNFSPHSTSTSASCVSNSSRPSVSSCRSPSRR